MQFMPVPDWVLVIAHVGWLIVHGRLLPTLTTVKFLGDTPIVYFILNESLRKEMSRMVRVFFKVQPNRVSYIHNTSKYVRLFWLIN